MVAFKVVLYRSLLIAATVVVLITLPSAPAEPAGTGGTCHACNCRISNGQILEELIDQKIRDSLAGKIPY